MDDKMGSARKLEPDDTSSTGLRDAFDLSVADSADSQILDEQAVKDILESGPYRMLDPSIGDGQDDKDNTALCRTYVLKPSTLNERMSIDELAELAEGADDADVATTEPHD
jgi:hypothetical protein